MQEGPLEESGVLANNLESTQQEILTVFNALTNSNLHDRQSPAILDPCL